MIKYLVSIGCVLAIAGCDDANPNMKASLEAMALAKCQDIIWTTAGAGAGIQRPLDIPKMKNFGGQGEVMFSWSKGSLPNGISASCGGRLLPSSIEFVTINGKDVIQSPLSF